MSLGGRMYLAITIDVEEDNWSDYNSEPVLSNIGKLTELQNLFDKFDVKPTYLISYPVAADKNSISILRKILDRDRCEIGAHLHPWNTPPFEEEKTVKNTMLFNLSKDLQYRKLESLHEKIVENFKMEPVAFRSGRWGFDQTVAENIHRLGYKVDTSVSPYLNWKSYYGPDFSNRSPMPQIVHMGKSGSPDCSILEVPATIGFLQDNYDRCNACLKAISGSALRHFRLIGVLDKLKIINKVWLSPESDDAGKMIQLAESIKRNNYPILNMFFHSPSLQHGLTHFTKTKEEEEELTHRIEKFLEYKVLSNIKSIKLSDSIKIIMPKE
jgi:hypothetical protein